MNCEQFEDIAAAFALGALPEDEMQAAREHLATCDQPHAEARGFQAVAASLAVAAPELDPPPALKARLMDAIRAEAPPQIAPAAPERRLGLWARLRGWLDAGTIGYGLAGALSVIVIALFIWNLSLRDDDEGGANQFVVELSGASGQLTVLPDEDIVIMDVEGLEPPPEGHVYQVWAISGGQPESLGIVEADEGGDVRQAMVFDESGVDVIAITVEPAPGVDQPTTDPIISAEL